MGAANAIGLMGPAQLKTKPVRFMPVSASNRPFPLVCTQTTSSPGACLRASAVNGSKVSSVVKIAARVRPCSSGATAAVVPALPFLCHRHQILRILTHPDAGSIGSSAGAEISDVLFDRHGGG